MSDLSLFMAAIPQPALLYGPDGRVAEANKRAAALAGRPLVGCSPADLIGIFHACSPDGIPLRTAELPSVRALAGEEAIDVPLVITTADGRTADIQVTASPLRDESGIVGALSIWRDATGFQRANRERNFLALLFDRMDDAVIATDPALCVIAWNRAAEALYGWTAGEAIGRPMSEVTGAEPQASPSRFDPGEAVPFRARQHRRDGRPLIVDGRMVAVRAPSGRLIGYLFVNRDVTSGERLREELAESEAKYRNLIEMAPDAILIHQDGAIAFANPAARALLGAAGTDDLIGRHVLALVHPGTRDHVAWNIEADLRGEESPTTTVDLLRMDGTSVTVQGRGAMIPLGGRPAVQVVLRDVTAEKRAEISLRESEERFRGMLRVSLDAVYRSDLVADRFEYISPVNEQITGFSTQEFSEFSLAEIMGRIHPDDRPAMGAVFAEAQEHQRGTFEYRFRCRDGSYRWLSDHFVFQAGDDGRPRYRDGVVRDVTEQREGQEALKRFAEDLARSNEELQRFAYVASHDLQEPLRSIVSFSQLLERRYQGRLDADADDYIRFIVEGGQRMQALIRDLLLLSRIETAPRTSLPTDPLAAVAGAMRDLEVPLREADATVAVDDLPAVTADEAQLRQVFLNLIGNAVKYRRADLPLTIRISARRQGEFCEFAVADNGIGIAPEYFDRIFEMFRRLHTKDQYEGTGIGLAIVRKIVERHGGRVGVESSAGEGSTFFFTLPAARPAENGNSGKVPGDS